MNMHTTARVAAWPSPTDIPVPSSDETSGRTEYDVNRWHKLTAQLSDLAARQGFSQAQVYKKIGMPSSTFSQWYHGKYSGRLSEMNRKVAVWLESMEEQGALLKSVVPTPGYVQTKTSREIENTLTYAHTTAKAVVVTTSAGMGKTMTFERFRDTRPHVYLVTASPYTKTVFGILNEITAVLGIREHDASKRARAIGEFLSRHQSPTLLIVDEAQNLSDQAVDQIRHFKDVYKVGIAYGGNTEIYSRFHRSKDGPSYDQIKSRISKRLKRERPYAEDIETLLDAYEVSDTEARLYLKGIAFKGGALRSMCETLELAFLMASGGGDTMQRKHVEAAWRDRDMEGY
ncbi:MAG: AAA family ATPase [Pseudomonadota bacterium]